MNEWLLWILRKRIGLRKIFDNELIEFIHTKIILLFKEFINGSEGTLTFEIINYWFLKKEKGFPFPI